MGSPVWKWKSLKNFRTKWAQRAANGPVWMPQALKPLSLIHIEKGKFSQLPILRRQRGFSAWGIQTGPFAALWANFVLKCFKLFFNQIGYSRKQKICFSSRKRTLHRRTGQNNRAHEELVSDNIIWRNALYFLDGHYVCLCVWLRDKSFEFFSNLSWIH